MLAILKVHAVSATIAASERGGYNATSFIETLIITASESLAFRHRSPMGNVLSLSAKLFKWKTRLPPIKVGKVLRYWLWDADLCNWSQECVSLSYSAKEHDIFTTTKQSHLL